jgi:hypothetical protein
MQVVYPPRIGEMDGSEEVQRNRWLVWFEILTFFCNLTIKRRHRTERIVGLGKMSCFSG